MIDPREAARAHELAEQIRKVLNGYPYGDGNPWPLDLLRDTADFLVRISSSHPEDGGIREALEKAAKQFRFYEQQHQNKTSPDTYKAEANRLMAVMCEAALNPAPEIKT